MRKLFIFSLFLFLFILFPKNTFALSYTACDNIEYNVVDSESLRDYVYFTYINDVNAIPFLMIHSSRNYIFWIPLSSGSFLTKDGSYYNYYYNDNGVLTQSTCNQKGWSIEDFSVSSSNTSDNVLCGRTNLSLDYFPNIYEKNLSMNLLTNENYTYQDIVNKYNCNGSSDPEEPETDEEVNMFNVVETFLIQFINILPFIIPFILIMNLLCRILFNERS